MNERHGEDVRTYFIMTQARLRLWKFQDDFTPDSPFPTTGAEICSGSSSGADTPPRMGDYRSHLKLPDMSVDLSGWPW